MTQIEEVTRRFKNDANQIEEIRQFTQIDFSIQESIIKYSKTASGT